MPTNSHFVPRAENLHAVTSLSPFNLEEWLASNADRLLPPIGNETIFKGNDTFIVMTVSGPNLRKDHHYNETEELFFQLRGDVHISLMTEEGRQQAHVREGDMLLLPPRTPHLPMRKGESVGLVIEKHRQPGERDGFLYFCESCDYLLYEEYLFLEDIVRQLPMVSRNFFGSVERRTCDRCGAVMDPPDDWEQTVTDRAVDNPYRDDHRRSVTGRSW